MRPSIVRRRDRNPRPTMVFSSVTFLFFFLPLSLALYFATPTMRGRNLVLLAISLLFYAWGEPSAILVLLGSIALNFVAALRIDAREGRARARALALAVTLNLLALVVFKYTAFLASILADLLRPFGVAVGRPKIALPLGVSFFTFHGLSYVIDVYRRRFAANRRPSEVALYLALFPQLVAGPIVRYKTVARQLRGRRHSVWLAAAGARIFVIGLAQKVLIANPVAPIAQALFDGGVVGGAMAEGGVGTPGFGDAWLGLLAYTVQIYFDFAGYSSMAVGLGLILGFSLPRNFRLPYASLSVTEFWRRWHISLSTWFRDYLYIPARRQPRQGRRGRYRNLVTVFFLCGLWHGANWTFVLWGAWHGAFLVLERLAGGRPGAVVPAAGRWLYTLLVVMGGWVLFRAHDLAQAGGLYAALLGGNGFAPPGFLTRADAQTPALLALAVGCALAVLPRWVRGWTVGRDGLAGRTTRDGLAGRDGRTTRDGLAGRDGRITRDGLAGRDGPTERRGRAVRETDAVPASVWVSGAWMVGLLLLSMLQVAGGSFSPFLYFRF